MYPHHDGLVFFPLTFYQGDMFVLGMLFAEGNHLEMAIFGGHVNCYHFFYE